MQKKVKKSIVESNIFLIFAYGNNMIMKRITYTKKTEEKSFKAEGVIMSNKVSNIAIVGEPNYVKHYLHIKTESTNYYVILWSNIKGYDAERLKVGEEITIKGIVEVQASYSYGGEIIIKIYRASEMK